MIRFYDDVRTARFQCRREQVWDNQLWQLGLARDVLRRLVNLPVGRGSLRFFYEVRGYLGHWGMVLFDLELALLHLEGKLGVQGVRRLVDVADLCLSARLLITKFAHELPHVLIVLVALNGEYGRSRSFRYGFQHLVAAFRVEI